MNRETYYSAIENVGGHFLLRFIARNRPKILMYHRVIDNPHTIGVKPTVFFEQMDYLKNNFNVIPMRSLVKMLTSGNTIKNAIALTFDDGYFDFYQNAWPTLKALNLPCTLYVTTKFVNRDCWLWPDIIKHTLINTKMTTFSDIFNGHMNLSKELINSNWSILANSALTLRNDERHKYISDLANTLKVQITGIPPDNFSAVTWHQLKEMSQEGLDVGSHTVSHPILSQLSSKDLRLELKKSKSIIEQKLGIEVDGICYPNGTPIDYNEATIQESKDIGYRYGVVAHDNKLKDIWRLGRQPGAFSLAEFKAAVCNARLRDWKK